jgi:hypothetical protein
MLPQTGKLMFLNVRALHSLLNFNHVHRYIQTDRFSLYSVLSKIVSPEPVTCNPNITYSPIFRALKFRIMSA